MNHCMKYVVLSVFFVLLAFAPPVHAQRMTGAEVNRVINAHIWSTPKWETIAEIREMRENVRQTGNIYGRQPAYRPNYSQGTQVVVMQPQQENTVAETPVTVSSIERSAESSPVTVSSTGMPAQGSPVSVTVSYNSPSGSLPEDIGRTCLPNPVSSSVEVLQSAALRGFRRDFNEAMTQQIEQIRDALTGEEDLSPEVLVARLKEKGATKEQLNELVLALENEEFSAISRIWITSGGDPIEAGKISRSLTLLSLVDSLEQSVEDQGVSADDLRNFKRAFDKSKQDRETEATVKKCLANLGNCVNLLEGFEGDEKQKKPEFVPAPLDEVTVVLYSNWPEGTIKALNENIFIVGTKSVSKKKKLDEKDEAQFLEIVEANLEDWLPQLPMSEKTPIATKSPDRRFTLHNTGSDAIVFTLDGSKKNLAPGTAESYAFPSSGSISVSTTKTRTVSSGGWRGGARQQNYQATQSIPVEVGTVYDCKNVSGSIELSPRMIAIAVDNTSNMQPFHMEINGKAVTVSPGETISIDEGGGSVTVRFARSSDPKDITSYELTESMICQPAISQADGKWALFAVDAMP